MKKMKELILKLNEASKAYYQQDKEIMSDFEYDKLYDQLVEMENKTGVVYPDSPTINVGYEILSSLNKVNHPSRMLSLDKTKEIEKLKSFLGENQGVLSYKMDGLTIVLNYENGILTQAVTRGNGEIGEDITHNAKVFKNIPLKIGYKGNITVRGEAVISFADFEKINENLSEDEKYKNPRNLCSGTVRQLNSKIAAERNVNFIAFTLVGGGDAQFKTQQYEWLSDLGFETVEYKIVNSNDVAKAVKEFEEKIPLNAYATDGLVLTYNNIEYSLSLGTTAKFPKDSIAFKWQDETAETTLRDIIWNTSRTGLINPIAVFDSVELEGTTVNRASLHNISIIENLKLGIGDKITVYKANMIIPQIAENLSKSGSAVPPDKCNVCGSETEIISLKDGKALKCTNPNCRARLVLSIDHYASRDAMNIEGLSEATIEKFVEKKFIENYTDIYNISKYKNEIIEMEGFGELSYNNLINSIEKSKNAQLFNFIYALGINNVGLSNAKLLSSYFKYDIEKIISATEDELCEIDGFGEIIANSVSKYFNNKKNIELLKKALSFINIEIPNVETPENLILKDKIFVITGDVNIFKNRKEVQEKIEKLGGKATNSVSSKTNYLINNDINSNSSKNKKAKELNIPIITENDFINMIGGL